MVKKNMTLWVFFLLSTGVSASEHLQEDPTGGTAENRTQDGNESGGSFWNWIQENTEPSMPYGFDGAGGSGNDGGGGGGGGGGGDGGGSGSH